MAVDVYQSTAFTQQKLNDSWALSLSGRRSYADVILDPLLSSSEISVRAPRYYDAQAKIQHTKGPNNNQDLLLYLSNDSFRFLGQDNDGNQQTAVAFGKRFLKLRYRWLKSEENGAEKPLLQGGPDVQDFVFQVDGEAFETQNTINYREELSIEATGDRKLGWRFGLDLLTGTYGFKYDLPAFSFLEPEEDEFFFLSPGLCREHGQSWSLYLHHRTTSRDLYAR